MANDEISLHRNVSPGHSSYLAASSGTSGIKYVYVIRQQDSKVELYIDHKDARRNEATFEELLSKKGAVEEAFGAPLNWERLEGKQACRVSYHVHEGGLNDRDAWPRMVNQLVRAMVCLEKAFSPHLKLL